MLSLRLLAALLLLLSVSAAAADDGSASTALSDVVTLTDANFDELTRSGSWLLEFYAPWCGHCKALSPVWEKAATELRSQPIRLGKVDCTSETAVASRHGVRGYPTIKFMRDGVPRPYNGGRSLADITTFAKRMTEPAVLQVKGADEVEAMVGKEAAVFVLLGDADTKLHTTFNKVAHVQQGHAAFLHFPSPSSAELAKYGAKANTPTIVYVSRGQDKPELLTDDVSSDELTRFVLARRLPLVSTLSADNFDELTNSPKRLALLVLPSSFVQSSTASSLIDSLYPLARRYRDKLHVATVDGSRYSRWLQSFIDTKQTHLPALLVFQDYPDTVWKPDTQPMGETDIGRMLTEVMDGSRPGTSSTAWYSPQRYLRPLNRFLLQFEEWQLITAVVVISCIVLGSVVLLTTWCMADDTHRVDDVAARARSVAGRAEKELEVVAKSGMEAAKRLAKSIDRVADKVVGEGSASEMKAGAAGRKEEAEEEDDDEDEEDDEGEDEIDEEEHEDTNGPTQRRGKSGAK